MTAREALIAYENDLVTEKEAVLQTQAAELEDLYDLAATERVERVATIVRRECSAAFAF